MKILYVIDSLKVGGAEVLLLSMIREYQRDGYDIVLAYFSEGTLNKEFDALGVTPIRISRHGLRDPLCILRMMRLIKREQPDVIHTHLRKSDLVGQFCAALMRVPVRISTAHNADPWRKNKILSMIDRWVTAGCHKVAAVSQEIRDYMIDVAGYRPDKVVAIVNGIDIDRFNPEQVQPIDRKSIWGLEPYHQAIGIVGRLDPQKDHETLIMAAKIVCQEFPDARFVIIGDGPLRHKLEHLGNDQNLSEHIIFAGVMRDMPQVLATLDIVVFSSRWEGLPVALLEAMAMSRPLVATQVGGIPGVLRHHQSGILVPPEDPRALAHGILQLVTDKPLASRLADSCRPIIEQNFTVKKMHEQIKALYTSATTPDNKTKYHG